MKRIAFAICAALPLLFSVPASAQLENNPMEANAKMGKFQQMSGAPMNTGHGGMYNRRGRGHMMGKGRMHRGMMNRRRMMN